MIPPPETKQLCLAAVLAAIRQHSADLAQPGMVKISQSDTDAVVILDEAHKIAILNQNAERIFGYKQEQLLGQPWHVVFPERLEANHCENAVSRCSAMHPLTSEPEHAIDKQTGAPVHASVSHYKALGARFTVLTLGECKKQQKPGNHGPHHAVDRSQLAMSYQLVHEDEKKHLFTKLHDDLAQCLSVLKLDLDWLEHDAHATPELISQRLQHMQSLLDDSIATTKRIAADLHPPLLDDFGLKPAVEWATCAFQKKTAIPCQLDCRDLYCDIQKHVALAIFRVIQESLRNIEKHAQATEISITLRCIEPDLTLSIRDNGVGIPAWPHSRHGSHGLNAMQERIYMLGGTIRIHNIIPHGLAIDVSVPIRNSPLPFMNG